MEDLCDMIEICFELQTIDNSKITLSWSSLQRWMVERVYGQCWRSRWQRESLLGQSRHYVADGAVACVMGGQVDEGAWSAQSSDARMLPCLCG